jgi:transcriptional regulator with XRE-family HTH domain
MTNALWFAGRLREMREAAKLTQQHLADKAGLKIGGIRDLEQGRRSPAWETVLALADALGVKCDAFTTPPADREPPGRGRPPKPATEEPAPNRLRGRPPSDARPSDSGTRKGKVK